MQIKRQSKKIISEQGSGISASKTINKLFDDWFKNAPVLGQLPAFEAGYLEGTKNERSEIKEIIEDHRSRFEESSDTEAVLREIQRLIAIRETVKRGGGYMTNKPLIIFTIGYQGRRIQEYIETLQKNHIGAVLDVRENASSRNPFYEKGPFSNALKNVDIWYIHIQSAGNPFRNFGENIEAILNSYDQQLTDNPQILQSLLRFVDSAKEAGRQVCLTCVESDYLSCHRSVLIEHIKRVRPGVEIIHL